MTSHLIVPSFAMGPLTEHVLGLSPQNIITISLNGHRYGSSVGFEDTAHAITTQPMLQGKKEAIEKDILSHRRIWRLETQRDAPEWAGGTLRSCLKSAVHPYALTPHEQLLVHRLEKLCTRFAGQKHEDAEQHVFLSIVPKEKYLTLEWDMWEVDHVPSSPVLFTCGLHISSGTYYPVTGSNWEEVVAEVTKVLVLTCHIMPRHLSVLCRNDPEWSTSIIDMASRLSFEQWKNFNHQAAQDLSAVWALAARQQLLDHTSLPSSSKPRVM